MPYLMFLCFRGKQQTEVSFLWTTFGSLGPTGTDTRITSPHTYITHLLLRLLERKINHELSVH
jgi:hypothetical protein